MIRRDHWRTSRRLLVATFGLTALVSASTVTAYADEAQSGVDDDGNVVAVGLPPVPPVAVESGVDDDGNEVAVGLPPVPPVAVESGVDDGGNEVAVGLPPVPPVAVESGVDDGGNEVAVGLPPVSPVADDDNVDGDDDDEVRGARKPADVAPATAAASTAVSAVVEQMRRASLLLDRQV